MSLLGLTVFNLDFILLVKVNFILRQICNLYNSCKLRVFW